MIYSTDKANIAVPSSQAVTYLNNTLQSYIDGNAGEYVVLTLKSEDRCDFSDIELSKLDEKLLRILAWQRLQQLVPKCPLSPKKGMLTELLTPAGERHSTVVFCYKVVFSRIR